MKLNNKGFAISTILYGLLALVVLILMLIFAVMRSSNNNSKELGESINSELSACREERLKYDTCLSYECNEKRTEYNDCIAAGGDCDTENQDLKVCVENTCDSGTTKYRTELNDCIKNIRNN